MLATLRPWMPFLRKRITAHIRMQIRQRALMQNKKMVKKTVSKKTQKPSVCESQLGQCPFAVHVSLCVIVVYLEHVI